MATTENKARAALGLPMRRGRQAPSRFGMLAIEELALLATLLEGARENTTAASMRIELLVELHRRRRGQ